MKRYRDPPPALKPSKRELPLGEWILCIIVVSILAMGAVYLSVVCGP